MNDSNVGMEQGGIQNRFGLAPTVVLAQQSSSAGGYFWGPSGEIGYIPDAGASGNAQPFNVANQLMLCRMYVSKACLISKCTISTTGTGATSDVSVGLYDDNGNLVLDSGSFNVGAVGGVATRLTKTFTPVLISPGWYWFAVTGSAAGGSAPCACSNPLQAVTNVQAMFYFNNTGIQTKVATAANTRAGLGAALPATLGALTPSAFTQILIALFEQ